MATTIDLGGVCYTVDDDRKSVLAQLTSGTPVVDFKIAGSDEVLLISVASMGAVRVFEERPVRPMVH